MSDRDHVLTHSGDSVHHDIHHVDSFLRCCLLLPQFLVDSIYAQLSIKDLDLAPIS
jgi:hypothetical protein